MAKANYFSKSSYTKGLQCPKILWMDAHMKDKFDKGLVDLNRLKAGNEVGDMAMAYFGDFVEVEMDFKFDQMAAKTAELAAEAAQLAKEGKAAFSICEATFVGNGMVCMADIVRVKADGTLDVVEVKSSTSVKKYHLNDIAYQVAVIEACGYEVASASIMHVNSNYVLDGELDIYGFFALKDVTDKAKERSQGVTGIAANLMAYRASEEEPAVEIGAQCNCPHACGYQTWCWRNVAPTVKGNALDAEKLANFLEEITYPVYHLDFETVQPIIPAYQGTKPWQQVPTQFSVHKVDAPSATPEHLEFLAQHDEDPRRALAEALCAAIPADACVTAYNMGFEKGRIRELAGCFADLADHLMGIHDRIVDLMVPFRKGWVYLEAMDGSYSIKKVLPALCPNDPQLDYAGLEGVHNGTEAMAAFEELGQMEPMERQRVREQLLRYCELDTLAMCKVHEQLIELAREGLAQAS